jgi:predicted outer membrane protein
MRKLGILALTCTVALSACRRGAERDDEVAADTLNAGESAELTTDLLSPVRSVSMVMVEYGDTGSQQPIAEDVRQYARTVALDHRGLIAALDSAARLRNATLQETAEGRELAQAVRVSHAGLENVEGQDYALAFVRAQVESNRRLLTTIDQQLTPTAVSPEMRQLLRDTRAMTDAHLTRARQLLGNLLGEEVEARPAAATQPAAAAPQAGTQPATPPAQPPQPETPPQDTIPGG